MKKLLDKAKVQLDKGQTMFQGRQKVLKQQDIPSSIKPPTPLELMRYRYHHGTNLGSVFVLEQWLSPSMFTAHAEGGSELDAVKAYLDEFGLDLTRAKWEEHWEKAVSDSDLDWLVNTAHCTSIRLPIGYFTLGPSFCVGTPFDGLVAQVYVNAWRAVIYFLSRCYDHGIGVLLDLHALPGGANGEAHSGTSSGKAELWGNQANLDRGQQCLVFMAQQVANGLPGVIGIELCNEATANASGLYQWYDSVIAAISTIDATIPIYISDAWDLERALTYAESKNKVNNEANSNPIIVDTHKYYTFSDADKAQGPQQIIGRIPNELNELNGKEGDVFSHGATQLIVGEYSCVLDQQTWSRVDPATKAGLITQFGRAQSTRWQQRSGGSFFWTYKMDWMPGGEWGFVEQTDKGNLIVPWGLSWNVDRIMTAISSSEKDRQALKDAAVKAHADYWNNNSPGQTFEFWRFGVGWDQGFDDALAFFESKAHELLPGVGADKIGNLDLWVRKREAESGQQGPYVWEWEQGFRQGIATFYHKVGL